MWEYVPHWLCCMVCMFITSSATLTAASSYGVGLLIGRNEWLGFALGDNDNGKMNALGWLDDLSKWNICARIFSTWSGTNYPLRLLSKKWKMKCAVLGWLDDLWFDCQNVLILPLRLLSKKSKMKKVLILPLRLLSKKKKMKCAVLGWLDDLWFNCQNVKMKNRLGVVLILPPWLSLSKWKMKNQNEMRCAWMIGYDLWFNCQNEK